MWWFMMKKFYEHKPHRLKNYNYSSNGSYFITICVKNKACLLGDIVAVDVIPLLGEMSAWADKRVMAKP